MRLLTMLPFLATVGGGCCCCCCPDADVFDLSTDEFDLSFLSVLTPFSTTLSLFSGSGINVTKYKQKINIIFSNKTHTNLPE